MQIIQAIPTRLSHQRPIKWTKFQTLYNSTNAKTIYKCELQFQLHFEGSACFYTFLTLVVTNIHLLYEGKTGRAWSISQFKEIKSQILFWSYSGVYCGLDKCGHMLFNTYNSNCQAYEGSNQIYIVVQLGSFGNFLKIIILRQKTLVSRVEGGITFKWVKHFQDWTRQWKFSQQPELWSMKASN